MNNDDLDLEEGPTERASSHKDDNSLSAWSSIIHAHGEQYRREQAERIAAINAHKPDVILRQEGVEHQFGYFRATNGAGVVRYTRWGEEGNWLPETKEEFTLGEIEVLASLL